MMTQHHSWRTLLGTTLTGLMVATPVVWPQLSRAGNDVSAPRHVVRAQSSTPAPAKNPGGLVGSLMKRAQGDAVPAAAPAQVRTAAPAAQANPAVTPVSGGASSNQVSPAVATQSAPPAATPSHSAPQPVSTMQSMPKCQPPQEEPGFFSKLFGDSEPKQAEPESNNPSRRDMRKMVRDQRKQSKFGPMPNQHSSSQMAKSSASQSAPSPSKPQMAAVHPSHSADAPTALTPASGGAFDDIPFADDAPLPATPAPAAPGPETLDSTAQLQTIPGLLEEEHVSSAPNPAVPLTGGVAAPELEPAAAPEAPAAQIAAKPAGDSIDWTPFADEADSTPAPFVPEDAEALFKGTPAPEASEPSAFPGAAAATPAADPFTASAPQAPAAPAAAVQATLPQAKTPAPLPSATPAAAPSRHLKPTVPAQPAVPFIPPEPESFNTSLLGRPASQDEGIVWADTPVAPAPLELAPAPIAPAPAAEAPVASRNPSYSLENDSTLITPRIIPRRMPETASQASARQLPAQPVQATQQASTQESKLARLAERHSQQGLKGFCLVSLRDDRDLVDARPEFYTTYQGQKYYFCSQAALEEFESAPGAYVPAAAGCDVVHLMFTGESVVGSLDNAVWYKGKLYMFSTAETLETFIAAPSSHCVRD